MMKPSLEAQKKAHYAISPPWLALGIGVGTALGVALHNIAVGVGLGTALGVVCATIGGKKGEEKCKETNEDQGAQPEKQSKGNC